MNKTEWSFTVEHGYPQARDDQKVTLYVDCEYQFITTKEEETITLSANCFTTRKIPLTDFQVNTEATFNDALSDFSIDHSAYSESLDKKSLVQLALSLASTKLPLRVRLVAVTVMPFEEFVRLSEPKDGVILEHVETEDKDECCAICLEELFGTGALRLVCKHVFHKPCFDKWRYTGRTCPMCRDAIWPKNGSRNLTV